MTTPTDHMTIAEIIHDFATRQGDLTDRWAREDLAAILEQRMVAAKADVAGEVDVSIKAQNPDLETAWETIGWWERTCTYWHDEAQKGYALRDAHTRTIEMEDAK